MAGNGQEGSGLKDKPDAVSGPAAAVRDKWLITLATVCILLGIGMAPLARFLRPLPDQAGWLAHLVVGIMPNFGAALALPFFFHVTLERQMLAARGWRLFGGFGRATCFAALGLIAWEVVQYLAWSYPVDGFDIMATLGGAGLAWLIHRFAQRRAASG